MTPVDTKITLDWEAPSTDGGSPITAYKLFWNNGVALAEATTPLTTTGASTTFFTATGLTRGTTYKFKVLASNAVNDGQSTATVSFIAAQAPAAPTAIIRLSKDSQTTMLIGWTAPTDDGGSPATLDYEVLTDNGLAQGYTLLVASTGGATQYSVTSLQADTQYFFRVRAKNEVGSSPNSSSQGFLAGAIPSEPLSLAL